MGLAATAVTGVGAANAQISDDVVRIGVLNDQSNVYADLGGPGSVVAARRTWSKRFFERHKRMPTMAQAAIYSATRHYLRAIEAAATDEAKAVMAKMREIPVN